MLPGLPGKQASWVLPGLSGEQASWCCLGCLASRLAGCCLASRLAGCCLASRLAGCCLASRLADTAKEKRIHSPWLRLQKCLEKCVLPILGFHCAKLKSETLEFKLPQLAKFPVNFLKNHSTLVWV